MLGKTLPGDNRTENKEFTVITFGCQMNESDSEKIIGVMENLGYHYTDDTEKADVLLINTCCVRETAENKVYGLLGRLKKIKDRRPNVVIGVGGCMTQVEKTALHIKKRYPHISFIFGAGMAHRLPELIGTAAESKSTVICRGAPEGVFEGVPVRRKAGIRAWVPVMYGCNNFCTYCIVPYVRGRERSRRPGDIIKEVRDLAEKGYPEVTLLGQNVNSYGKDFAGGYGFGDLLEELNRISGLLRIRYMTSHPRDFDDNLIHSIRRSEKVCRHIHLPVQSGSTKILRAMNRGYTREYYLGLVEKIKKLLPDISITTDIMVGFPGESEEDFADTIDLVQTVRFDAAFTFVYNKRPGTPAAGMPNQVEEKEKSRRIEELIRVQNGITMENNANEAGRVYDVLVEGISKNTTGMISGRTGTNKLVIFPGREEDTGKLVPVKICGGTLTHLKGEILEKKNCPC
ncbi:MAG: tRNA (N6-isopentenyl adenosine(37)-C2)-methylthiotransferase MiaB [Bacillota bacterium]